MATKKSVKQETPEVLLSKRLLQYFEQAGDHEQLGTVTQPYEILATFMFTLLPENDQKVEALRKLLDSLDCAVRSVLDRYPPEMAKENPESKEAVKRILAKYPLEQK